MPCDTIRTMEVTLERCDPQHMLAALSDLGLRPILSGEVIRFGNNEQINCRTGQATLQWNRTAQQIKQAYSRAIVQRTAKRFGWQTKAGQSQNQFQVIKR